jgi:two-component system, OmpR family, response regulator
VPIIFLTAKTMKEDVLHGFKIGADDYISKPFNSEELLYRIQAVLKRSQPKPDPKDEVREYRIGKYIFNYPLRTLHIEGSKEEVKLSPKEAQLLKMFCHRVNDVLPRSEALTKIWQEDNYFTARSMDVFVTKLRKYLADDSNIEIVNIHGNGFQLLIKTEEAV